VRQCLELAKDHLGHQVLTQTQCLVLGNRRSSNLTVAEGDLQWLQYQ